MWEVGANDQIFKAIDYEPLIVAYHNGSAVRISDIGAGGRFGRGSSATPAMRTASPPVLVIIFRQPGANIIDTVDRIKRELAAAEGRDSARRSD